MKNSLCRALLVVFLLGTASCTDGTLESDRVAAACHVVQQPVGLPSGLEESSGVAVSRSHPGVIWTHNDSGGEAELYALNTAGALIGTVRIEGVENIDWEDIAGGECGEDECLYIGDIGDNERVRSEIVLHRVLEPSPTQQRARGVESFRMRYPDGPRDAEALFVLPGEQVFLVTKGGEDPIAIYRYPGQLRQELVELERVRVLAPGPTSPFDQVTGADATRDGHAVVLRTYGSLLIYRRSDLLEGEAPNPVHLDLEPLAEPQGEGIGVGPNGAIVLTSEAMTDALPGSMSMLRCELPAGPR